MKKNLLITTSFYSKLSIGVLLLLFSVSNTTLFGQANPSTCALRWTDGDSWYSSGTICNGVVNDGSGKTVRGIVACASAAGTMPGAAPLNGCTYNPSSPSQFKIETSPLGCYNPSTGTTANPISLTPPATGDAILWLNFDIRAFGSNFDIQLITNDKIGWALYYSTAPTNCTSAAPNGQQLSGNWSSLTGGAGTFASGAVVPLACGTSSSST